MNSFKTYLNTPYKDKDQVKTLGGKWDAEKKKWYVPSSVDITPFAKWLPSHVSLKEIQSKQTLPPSDKPLDYKDQPHNLVWKD